MKRLFASAAIASASCLLCVNLASAQQPYVSEVRLFASNFCPVGWAPANGQILPISQNIALFSLIGTFYGGDGKSNFALPNLSGRAPYGTGPGAMPIGTAYGASSVTLTTGPHPLLAVSDGKLLRTEPGDDKIHETGAGESVATQSPALTLTWCIALFGIFPPRN